MLARELDRNPWTASRLEFLLIRESRDRESINRCARGLFARALIEILPRGWEANMPHAFDTTMIGIVMSYLPRYPDRLPAAIDGIRARLRELDVAIGWLPSGADDPVLLKLFDDEWSDAVVTNPRWVIE